jgi:sarcosine oxidase subunit beta
MTIDLAFDVRVMICSACDACRANAKTSAKTSGFVEWRYWLQATSISMQRAALGAPNEPLMAEVVVVGGGIIGASVAYHLAARGMRDVVALERGTRPGEGSTGRATGGFRVGFASAIDIALSQLALQRLEHFGEETGGESGYVPAGYLWLATDHQTLLTLRDALEVQREHGVQNAREVNVADITSLNPALATGELRGGTYCPTDGFIRPLAILAGYQAAAERLSVRFLYDAEVTAFTLDRTGAVTHVRTARDVFAAHAVVNAAGPWAAHVALLAGARLPVTPLRRQVALTQPTSVLPSTMPMTIFASDGFHARVRDDRVLLLMASPVAADPFDVSVEAKWIERVSAIARRRLPLLAGVAIDHAGCWAGLYEQSPDGHAILGAATEVPNLYYVNGSSGHGAMHAPALGMLLAELIIDGRTTLDISPLAPDRFRTPLPTEHRLL